MAPLFVIVTYMNKLYSHPFLHLALLPFPAVAVPHHNDLHHLPNAVELPDTACEMCVYSNTMYVHRYMYTHIFVHVP